MDKRAARQLAYRVVATLLDDPQRVEEVVKREGLVASEEEAEALLSAVEELRQKMLELAEDEEDELVLRQRYAEAQAQLAQEDHTELLRQLRGPGLFDEGGLDD